MSLDKFIERAEKEGFFNGQQMREWLRTAPLDDDVYCHMARHYNKILAPLIIALKEAKEGLDHMCGCGVGGVTNCMCCIWLEKWDEEFSE